MGTKNGLFVVGLVILCLLAIGQALQTSRLVGTRLAPQTSRHAHFPGIAKSLTISSSGIFMTSEQTENEESGSRKVLRDRLRNATGFSLTAFRSAWRAATGFSLSAVYATALAASGLWIRKITSVALSIFPAWFRYFLQPFLVAYYLPMFIIRGLTGPTRKQAKARHEAVKDSLRDAVEFAKHAKSDGYWPVKVTDEGDFELVSPPKPLQNQREELADAVAESVELAMEQGFKPDDQPT